MSGDDKHRRSPQARLQDRVLLYLAHHEVETITELSRTLGSSRSSTSRATNRLKTEGLVVKVEGKWGLTEEGRAEVVRIRHRLPERSKQARREIDRIARLQRDYESTIGSSAFEHVTSALRSLPKIHTGFENINELVNMPSVVPGFSALTPDFSALTPDFSALTPGFSALTPGFSALTPDFSALTPDFSALATSPLRMDYHVRPFFEAMRLVDSIGVGSPSISSSLEAISESLQSNLTDHMKSIAEAAPANSLASARVEPLSGTLDFLNSKLGEGAFASIQVRAVEDLLNRVSPSDIPSNLFESLIPHMDLASGTTVRQILEKADFGALLEKYGLSSEVFVHPEDNLSASPKEAPAASLGHDATASLNEGVGASELPEHMPIGTPARSWDELPEAVKLRIVAAATFIILHVALLAAQEQQDNSEYIKDIMLALGGTAATVTICKQVELFKEEED